MRALTPAGIAPPFARYAHGGVLEPGARLLHMSGQLGVAPDGSVPDGADAQARLCFDNITAILAQGGMSARDVFHLNAYVTDRAHMAAYMAARDAFLAEVETLPTSTLVIVSGFTRPEFLVEVEAWGADYPAPD